jgi:hypothetical protein
MKHDPIQVEVIDDAVQATPAPVSTAQAIVPRVGIAVRVGTMDDLPLVDRLQKQHSRELGFLPMQALIGKIELGQVLVAEVVGGCSLVVDGPDHGVSHQPSTINRQPTSPVGYLIAADRYFKRDEIGYITQINVVSEYRRSLVAATLLQAQFDRSASGCRLYCCWCAQDLKANAFWESMGFTAIAFRTGSLTKGKKQTPRVHIFWQKRVRAGDEATPWWYPSTTGGGVLRADRLVFPVPAGVHWSEVRPVETGGELSVGRELSVVGCQLSGGAVSRESKTSSEEGATSAKRVKKKAIKRPVKLALRRPANVPKGGLWFAPEEPETTQTSEIVESAKVTESKREVAAKKIDPRLVAMARELRDQWQEREAMKIVEAAAKHDVRRLTAGGEAVAGWVERSDATKQLAA